MQIVISIKGKNVIKGLLYAVKVINENGLTFDEHLIFKINS